MNFIKDRHIPISNFNVRKESMNISPADILCRASYMKSRRLAYGRLWIMHNNSNFESNLNELVFRLKFNQ